MLSTLLPLRRPAPRATRVRLPPRGETFEVAALGPGRVESARAYMDEVNTRACELHVDPDGFVLATMRDGARFELDDAKEAVAAMRRLVPEQRTSVLVDMRRIQSQSREARAYFTGPEAVARLDAVALLVSSPVSRMIATFFLRFRQQPIPTRLFDDEAAARAWLRDIGA